MAKYAHADVLDGGLNAIRLVATQMLLLDAYIIGDSYATVVGNKLAEVTMDATDPTTDYVLSGADAAARVLTTAVKSSTASATGAAAAIAFTDGVSKVLWVTTETSGQTVTLGNTVNFPALTYTSGQPT